MFVRPCSTSHGPNGLVVDDGLVFGATGDGAFALDQETGKEVWSKTLTKVASEGVDMAPGYHDGRVYVSTVPVTATETYGPGGVGLQVLPSADRLTFSCPQPVSNL